MVRAENPELVETESSRKLVLEARSTTTAQLEQALIRFKGYFKVSNYKG